jgi:phosphopantothenoylcysteine decarboxylase/phosphopantothenate--cysteine ligase
MPKKQVVLAVTGSIAAYKAADIVRRLQDEDIDVTVMMTAGAQKFITSLTFEALTHKPVYCDMFTHEGAWDIAHVALAKRADAFLVAPATADIISKIAQGIADDFVTCMAMTTKAPIVIAPAMNDDMFSNKILQENINKLMSHGVKFIEPKESKLACDVVGKGALADVSVIVKTIVDLLK